MTAGSNHDVRCTRFFARRWAASASASAAAGPLSARPARTHQRGSAAPVAVPRCWRTFQGHWQRAARRVASPSEAQPHSVTGVTLPPDRSVMSRWSWLARHRSDGQGREKLRMGGHHAAELTARPPIVPGRPRPERQAPVASKRAARSSPHVAEVAQRDDRGHDQRRSARSPFP